jgi:hypothetical protein
VAHSRFIKMHKLLLTFLLCCASVIISLPIRKRDNVLQQFLEGTGDGLKNYVMLGGTILSHPVESVKQISNSLSHPVEGFKNISYQIKNSTEKQGIGYSIGNTLTGGVVTSGISETVNSKFNKSNSLGIQKFIDGGNNALGSFPAGAGFIAAHPIKTAQGLLESVANPVATIDNVAKHYSNQASEKGFLYAVGSGMVNIGAPLKAGLSTPLGMAKASVVSSTITGVIDDKNSKN